MMNDHRTRAAMALLALALIGIAGFDWASETPLAAQPAPVRLWLPLAAADVDILTLPAPATSAPRVTLPPGTVAPPTPRPSATPAASATPTMPSGSPTATLPPGLPTPDLGAGVPKCDRTTGDAGGLRISLDGGKSLLPNATTLRPLAYTWAIDIDPRNPKVLLQLHQGGLFRSTDAGCSFTALPNVPAGAWDKLVRAPSRPELWVLASVFESRMAWTADDGATWTVEQLPDDVMHLAIDPGDDGIIGPGPGPFPLAQEDPDPAFHWTFAGRRPFLYTRTATDQKWELKPIPLPDGQSVISAAHGPKRLPDGGTRWLVGASTRGLWRSDDGGETWSETNEGLFGEVGEPPTAVTAVVPAWISVAPSDPDVVYAVLNQVAFAEGRDAGGRAIWRSDDGAATWSRVVEDGQVPDEGAPGGVPERVTLTGGTRVFVAPDDPRRAYFAHGNYFQGYGTDLFRSTDGLQSLAASHFDDFYEIFDLAFGPQGSAVLFVAASSDIPSD